MYYFAVYTLKDRIFPQHYTFTEVPDLFQSQSFSEDSYPFCQCSLCLLLLHFSESFAFGFIKIHLI